MSTNELFVYHGRPAAWIAVHGEDSDSFLQSQFSNDLCVADGSCVYGLWLDHRGRIHGDAFALRVGGCDWRLCSAHTPADAILAKLKPFIVADDVELDDSTPEVALLEISGARAEDALAVLQIEGGLPAAGCFVAAGEGCRVWRGRAAAQPSFTIVGPDATIDALAARLRSGGAIMLDAAARDYLRFVAGYPAVPTEAGAQDTPFDVGLEEFVSFTKGCFLGQEVVARLRNTGRATRCGARVELRGARDDDAPPPALPLDITAGGSVVGQLRSALRRGGSWCGFAVIKRKALEAGEPLRAGDAEVVVRGETDA